MPDSADKRIQMLVFLKEGEDESYDQLAEIDRLDLRRKSVEVKTFKVPQDEEAAREMRVERVPSILFVKDGEILKRLNGLTQASVLGEALSRVEHYQDPFSA
ncbi:MAG TPA: hypothetical protein VNZ52_08440 [Candidatus Thermoplasmatota archaeon]|nr:hypothetical protein [Candidatus Thermoplasmatota archaeon]